MGDTAESSPQAITKRSMTGPRIALASALGLALASASQAKVKCPERVDLRACIGIAAAATVEFCFEPDLACSGTGYVREVRPPAAPFTITGMRVQGALGTRSITTSDLPLLLLPAERLLIDVSTTVNRSGEQEKTLELVLANRLDGDSTPAKEEGDVCKVDLRVRAPSCLPADQAEQCAEEVCAEGRCVAGAGQGSCDDGDACTTGDACSEGECSGTRVDCDDGIACTQDVCTSSGCAHQPSDALCDSGQCSVASCRPGDAAADGRGCVAVEVGEGDACTDDGVACTDDRCTAGSCLHFPVDSRCPGTAACSQAACVPGDDAADAAGCVSGPAGTEGGVCAEDGDPCSDDRCRGGTCEHQLISQHLTCEPVENAFRRALALLALTRSLAGSMVTAGATQLTTAERLTAPLTRLDQELDATLDTLSGRTTIPILVSRSTGLPETPAQARARAALLLVGRMPLEARTFLEALSLAPRDQGVDKDELRALTDQGRVLRRGVKRLKTELKRLRRSTLQFVK
jgi:hypothetical protein